MASYDVVLKNGVPHCPQCGRQVTYRRARCRTCGFRYVKTSLLGNLVKLVFLAFLGIVGLGVLGSMMGRQPANQPAPVPSPTFTVPARGPTVSPVVDTRFGLTEDKRIEINNAIWQAGMWAHEEANRLYPFSKIDEATLKDAVAGRKLDAERHALYEGRKKIALALVAKKYGLGVDVLAKIDEEGAQKKWKVLPTPVLFDQDEASRAVLISKTGTDPIKEDETKLRSFEERQRTIELRKERRAARRKNQP